MTMDQPTPGSTPPPTWTPDAPQGPVSPPPAAPTLSPPTSAPPTSFAPAPLIATTKPGNRASLGTALLLVGALVAIGGVAFAVGRVTAPTATAATNGLGAGRGTGNGGTGFGGGPVGSGGPGGFGGVGRTGGGLSVSGTVVSIDASTIQVKLANGTTETLNLAPTVTYRDSTTGSASDVTPGSTVDIGLSLGAGTGPTASGQPRPSGGFGGGFGGGLTNATVGTITVVK